MLREVTPLPPASVLVAIPALNEQATIGAVVSTVLAEGFQVLVVDDGSWDRTGAIAAAAGAQVARLPINLGVGGALQCAFTYAVRNGFRAVVQVDADGQHPADQISSLLVAAQESGAHMVVGSRFRSSETTMNITPFRRLAMKVLSLQASLATSTRITDSTSGFRLIREPLLSQFAAEFPAHYLGDTHEAMVSAGRAGYIITEVPAKMHLRQHGASSANVGSALRYALRSALVGATGLNFTTLKAHKLPDSTRPKGGSHSVRGSSRDLVSHSQVKRQE